jgi:hypothetical protein
LFPANCLWSLYDFPEQNGRVLVAHACNPSYSGGRDQEFCGSKPAWGNYLQDSILKKTITKRAGGVAQGVGPEFNPSNKKRKKEEEWTLTDNNFFHPGANFLY